jgi:DNA invertase Pin-like site-specific DNA recombinase
VNAMGYLRVSTGKQLDSGAGLAAQRSAILAEATRRGWTEADLTFVQDAASGSNTKRPALETARKELASGAADALVVAKADRLSRSLIDFVGIMQEAQKQGWSLVALDVPVDLSTLMGEMLASIMATFANLERRLIGERTRDALAEKRAAGVRLGRPRQLPDEIRERIERERAEKRTLRAIAEGLNADGVACAHKGKAWYPSSVRAVLTAKRR